MGGISSCCRGSSGAGGNSGASGDGTAGGVGSALDRVIAQASGQDNCLLYRLADYKNGGELLEAFATGGQHEVERLIREQFGVFMYADGKGQVINRAEYLRWKFRSQTEVVVPIETSLSAMDPLSRWRDHEACWQMQYRGSLGEALLHVLIICDTRTHTRLARTLLKCFPKLSLDVVEGEEYLGASALHLAIAYSNNELVRDLVEAGADISQRAIGTFFLPRDQQRPRPARHTDYEGLAYLGEFPLAWAACCANESVYNLLIDAGADPDAQDTFGNVILHMVVVCDKLDMFGYALRHPKLPASNGITNHAGLTPLTLACKLGRAEVFREMLELSAREFWRYSNITCSAYPLNALDTLLPDGRTNWNSALFIILNGTKEEHLDMLDGGIIQRLLEEKWKTFARRQFLKRLAILFLHLLTLSTAVYLRPTDHNAPLLGGTDWHDIARYCFEIGTVLGVLSYVLFQQGGEIKNQGLVSFLKQQTHAPAKAIFLISNLLILACIPFRLANDKRTEEAILLFAVPGSWFLLMFFAGAVRLTGPFVTMVYSMITGDMLTFGIIYSVMLFGFSQSFFFLYKGSPAAKTSLYGSYPSTWMALFQITLGDYNYSELSYTTYPTLSKAVFAIFMVLVPILLLNMLIAMMGNTYAHVIEQSEKEWMKQWAKIVVTLERAVNQADAHQYLQEYSIKLGPGSGDDPNATEQRGVMVIKSKSKTRAKQRKGAVSNWKRVGKVTINELRKRGMTGEQLRRIMWGRASISTPTHANLIAATLGITATDADAEGSADGPPSGPTATDALTAALDQIAFAHDIDLKGAAAGLPDPPPDYQTSISPAPSHSSVKNMDLSNGEKSLGAKVNGRSNTLPWGLERKNTQEKQLNDNWIHAEDPLHLLVIGDGSLEAETAAALAAAAAAERFHSHGNFISDKFNEVLHTVIQNIIPSRIRWHSLEKAIAGCSVDDVCLISDNAENKSLQELIKKEKGDPLQSNSQKTTIIDIEPSDSDGLEQSGVDGPLLGRSARMYRARSSKWQYPSSNQHRQMNPNLKKQQIGWHWPRGGTSYEKWGWQRADSTSSSTNSEGYINYGLILSPDKSVGGCSQINTTESTERQKEKSGNSKYSKREQLNNSRRKLRPKTTKPGISNKVAPNNGAHASKRLPARPATAGKLDEMGIHSEDGDQPDNSSDNVTIGWRGDFMQPVHWSTQTIANMNTLLAWDKSDNEDKDADDDL